MLALAFVQVSEFWHLHEQDPPVLQPREVLGLPKVRALRSGGHHTLASTADGDLFMWGCGLTHQLANRPRDVSNPIDTNEEPADELKPYRVSSKQLQKRFVMLADGGAQHSVELAWDGAYSAPSQDGAGTGLAVATSGTPVVDAVGVRDDQEMVEPPAKRRATAEDLVGMEVQTSDDASKLILASGTSTGCFANLAADDGKWKCETCSLRWEDSIIKCKACESYKPGLSEEDVAKIQAQEEERTASAIAMFRSSSTTKPTGFAFGGAATSGTTFGAGSVGSMVFGFGTSTPAQASSTASPFGGFSGFSGFGQSSGSTTAGPVTFGFGSQAASFGAPAVSSAVETKVLAELPDFTTDRIPTGDVFVHGSGECDQLGLGDAVRERQKPTLVKSLTGLSICEIAVGAMHVLCLTTGGAIYSWGCNDDGALGRASSDGSDGGPSDVEPHVVMMPQGVVVRHVSCGDGHSCALDDSRRVWLWGTYKDSNGYIGIVRKRKQEAEVLEKSAEPTLVLESCLQVASGANHTVALVDAGNSKKVFAWGSNATGQLGLQEGCGFSERLLPCSGSIANLAPREGGGCEIAGEQVVRLHLADGSVRSAASMTVEQVQQTVAQGAKELVLQLPDREVPKTEKKKLLHPQDMPLAAAATGESEVIASGVHASAECSFVTFQGGSVRGCGLNGDGQVGVGFVSMAVPQLQAVPAVAGASWLGGGLYSTAALVDGRVFTWGKAEECGLGLGAKARWDMQRFACACSCFCSSF